MLRRLRAIEEQLKSALGSSDSSSSASDAESASGEDGSSSDFGVSRTEVDRKPPAKKKRVSVGSTDTATPRTSPRALPGTGNGPDPKPLLASGGQAVVELNSMTCVVLCGKKLTPKEVDGKLKKSLAIQSELETFKDKLVPASPERQSIIDLISEIHAGVERVSLLKECFEQVRKSSMTSQVIDGRIMDCLMAGLSEMQAVTAEEVLVTIGQKIADYSPLYLFKYLCLTSEEVEGMFTLSCVREAKYLSLEKLLVIQRSLIFRWFDSIKNIKSTADVTQNLPKNLYQPGVLRTGLQLMHCFRFSNLSICL